MRVRTAHVHRTCMPVNFWFLSICILPCLGQRLQFPYTSQDHLSDTSVFCLFFFFSSTYSFFNDGILTTSGTAEIRIIDTNTCEYKEAISGKVKRLIFIFNCVVTFAALCYIVMGKIVKVKTSLKIVLNGWQCQISIRMFTSADWNLHFFGAWRRSYSIDDTRTCFAVNSNEKRYNRKKKQKI